MENNLNNERDTEIWKLAKKRVSFRRHLISYLIINAFLWTLWYLGCDKSIDGNDNNFPWPIFCSIGWGIGILFNYMDAFVFNKPDAIEREYEKLKNKI